MGSVVALALDLEDISDRGPDSSKNLAGSEDKLNNCNNCNKSIYLKSLM